MSAEIIPIPLPERYALHIDGRGRVDALSHLRWLEQTIRDVAVAADMSIINVLSSNVGMDKDGGRNHPHESGYSIQALITTSHIAIHTWPHLSGRFMFDLVSCKPFDDYAIRELLEKHLGISEYIVDYTWNSNSKTQMTIESQTQLKEIA